MTRSISRTAAFLAAGVALTGIAVTAQQQAPPPTVVVYRSPSCGCCLKWVGHLEANGFKVEVQSKETMTSIKRQHGVPEALQSCHTALVGSYVIEGHVPAADVKKLLATKPAVKGLAVPGMPIGSPGMEGGTPQKYDTVAFSANGKTTVFASH